MHEMGHALGAGWADDTPIPFVGFACEKGMEIYSNDFEGERLRVGTETEVNIQHRGSEHA